VFINPINILIISIEKIISEGIQTLLNSKDYSVFNVFQQNGIDAISRLFSEKKYKVCQIDAILVDHKSFNKIGSEALMCFYRQNNPLSIIVLFDSKRDIPFLKHKADFLFDYLILEDIETNQIGLMVKNIIEKNVLIKALYESNQKFQRLIRRSNDGFWDWNLKSNQIFYSNRWKEILGYRKHDIKNHPEEWFSRVHPSEIDSVREEILKHINKPNSSFDSEFRIMSKSGIYKWVISKGYTFPNSQGHACRMSGSITDIHQMKIADNKIREYLIKDNLTNLPNRSQFLERVNLILSKERWFDDSRFAVLVFDIDRFMNINERFGHQFGDSLIREISRRVFDYIQEGDTLARICGDEFGIIIEETIGIPQVLEITNKLLQLIRLPIQIDNQEVYITASIGVVVCDNQYKCAENVLGDAYIALSRAKKLGKNIQVVFSKSMRSETVTSLELENDFRQAISDIDLREDELEMVYQPIVSLENGKIEGFEALARWTHPEYGEIYPKEFIPIAEESNLIQAFGAWGLQQACEQLRIWQNNFISDTDDLPLSINVNFSRKQLTQPNVVDFIESMLKNFDINPSTLNLEITESLLIESDDGLFQALSELRRLGIKIFIDDFGRGYSSFSSLQQFPVNTLKIDSLFTRWLGNGGQNYQIVQTIMQLAASLGKSVVAEGVETKTQLQQLQAMECQSVQGYYLSEPLDKVAAGEMLTNNRQVFTPN